MTVNPKNVYEAHTIFIADLLRNTPHLIKYEATEADWNERLAHLVKIGNAIDAYLLELGRDCAQHAHLNLDMGPFTDTVGPALDDACGQMQRGAIAAREYG